MARVRDRRRDRTPGQAAIEFVLILPIAVAMLALAADAVSLYNARSALEAASAEGARALNIDPGIAPEALAERARAAAGLGDSVSVTVSRGPSSTESVPMAYQGAAVSARYSKQPVTVRAEATVGTLIPYLSGGEVELAAETTTVVSDFSGGR